MNNEIELLPCPFCGGEPRLSDGECGHNGMPRNYRNPMCTRCYVSFGYAPKDEAIAMWNRRVPALAQAQTNEGVSGG